MNLNKKVKGFTLVELIVVIAILAILAGTGSLMAQTFIRNSRLEALNDRAQLVFTAFQDILLDCEVNQDNSIFEPRGDSGDESTSDIIGAVIFFRISQYDRSGHPNVNGATGLGDEIHIMTAHTKIPHNAMAGNVSSISVWAEGSTNPGIASGSGKNSYPDHGASYWKKLDKYISGRLDDAAAGTYCVAVDLVNYQVISVICRDIPSDGKDPKTGLYSEWEVADSSKALGKFINGYGGDCVNPKAGGIEQKFPVRAYILKDKDQQRAISTKKGVDMGSYPYGEDIYDKGEIKSPI